jgi:hypothetical protein
MRARVGLFLIFITIAVGTTTPSEASSRPCLDTELARLMDQHAGEVLDQVTFFEGKLTQGYMDLEKHGLYDPDAIYIGIANHHREGEHHYYMMSGGKRFDGGILYNPAKVKTSYQTPLFAKGVIFKIKGEPRLAVQTRKSMEELKGFKGLTCLHGACKVLDEVEITIPRRRGIIFPTSAEEFAKSLMKGEVKVNGKPLQVQMIATSERELAHYLKKLKGLDTEAVSSLLTHSGVTAGIVILGVAVGGRIIWVLAKQEWAEEH